ncbi:hypothetical protein F4780DRAFT_607489 [Xylariomycetidae sp. FL0641]|nr:hypothetical protein F4780DRAFT_607489 [Xylariomycetidae sp. FL0641]
MAPPVNGHKLNENGIPDFDALPLRKDDPPYSAWGLYGDDDQLGTLNRLTDERVAAAAKGEIRTGRRISLNLPLDAQSEQEAAFFGRERFVQTLLAKPPRCVNDDVWSFNSQVASQWDGLRHFAYQRARRFYGGVTMEQIHQGKEVLGVHAWSREGIVGRGVLVDYHRWRHSHADPKPAFSSFESTSIPLADLEACLAAQGTEVRFGDILFIRTGFPLALSALTPAQLAAHQAVVPPRFGGVGRSLPLLRWLWARVAAVAADHPSFEAWPPAGTTADGEGRWALHEVLLSGWGCPVGELFDLEALAAECARQRRWSFFVASEPCHVPGGVASPPNALAIF